MMHQSESLFGILWICAQILVFRKLTQTDFQGRFDDVFNKAIAVLLYLPGAAFGAIFYSHIWHSLWAEPVLWAYIFLIYLFFYDGKPIAKITLTLTISVITTWIGQWSIMAARILQKNGLLTSGNISRASDLYLTASCLSLVLICILYLFMKKTIEWMQRIIQRYAWIFWLFCALNLLLILPWMHRLSINGISLSDFALCSLTVFNIICLVCILLVYNAQRETTEKYRQLELLEVSGRKQAETYKQYYEEIARKSHDQKHQLRLIQNYIENNESDNALKYIHGLLDQKKTSSNTFLIKSGNMVVDMLLREYMDRMAQEHIVSEINASVPFCRLSDADLCILLGNLLDNALEAAGQCPQNQRQISVTLCCIKRIFILTIQNSTMQQPIVTKSGLATIKKEAWKHGFGMKNVRDIVEKYDGEIHFNYSDHCFQVDVQI